MIRQARGRHLADLFSLPDAGDRFPAHSKKEPPRSGSIKQGQPTQEERRES